MEPFDAPSPLLSVEDVPSSPLGAQEEEEWGAAQQLIKAVEERCGGVMFSGGMKGRARRVAVRLGLDQALALVARSPVELKIPGTVDWLERIARGEDHLANLQPRQAPGEVVSPAYRPFAEQAQEEDPATELERARTAVEAYTTLGRTPPKNLLDRLVACENGSEVGGDE